MIASKSAWFFLTAWLLLLLLLLQACLSTSDSTSQSAKAFEQACENDAPLGLISGEVKDWQITASSTYPEKWAKGCSEHNARLYLKNKLSWCAKSKSSSEWLQIDLGVIAQITGVMTQGRGDGVEFVRSFMLSYSEDGQTWNYVMDSYKNQKIFEGNSDSYSVKHNYLDEPIHARLIKFHVFTWNSHPSLRVEILGCQPCRSLLGLPPYGRLSASSSRGIKTKKTCTAPYGHILSNKAWCSKQQDNLQWLEIDLGPPTKVTGLIIKGRGDGKSQQWVQTFRLAYSNDSSLWYFYKDALYLGPKNYWPQLWMHDDSNNMLGLIFSGNTDGNSEKIHYLNKTFVARFVRFHPISWKGRIAMRAGVFGCPHRGECGKGYLRINKHSQCVANLAFGKRAWVNVGMGVNRKRKRGAFSRIHWHRGQALRAIDGQVKGGLNSCTVLKNGDSDIPAWFVDLKTSRDINGLIIYTLQDRGNFSSDAPYEEHLSNLDRLAVYVDSKPRQTKSISSPNLCGYLTRLNNAIFEPKIHIPCSQPISGRYVYVEAWGIKSEWNKSFNAILCEVMIY